MQIDQIIVRPSDKSYIIQYSDNVGRSSNLMFDASASAAANNLIADAQQKLPTEQNRPDKTEIQQEIDELQYRLAQLNKSIGIT